VINQLFDDAGMNICKLAIIKFGSKRQIKKVKEELFELLIELGQEKGDHHRTVDEISDALIVLHQMAMIQGWSDVKARLDFKLERLKCRVINNEP
jgi:hypothetical protein